MAVFVERPGEWIRLDWKILQSGAVSLFHREEALDEALMWFLSEGYRVAQLRADTWGTNRRFYADLRRQLRLGDKLQEELADLRHALCLVRTPDDGGLVLVIRRYDLFQRTFPEEADALLDAIQEAARFHMLLGRRFLALVQTDDPAIECGPVGWVPVLWNPIESR